TVDDAAPLTFYRLRRAVEVHPEELRKSIAIRVKPTSIYRRDATFSVRLTNPINATLRQDHIVARIPDESSPPAFSIENANVSEGNDTSRELLFKVTLAGETAVPAKVDFTTMDGTAKGSTDYIASQGQLVFAPGEHSKLIPIIIHGDSA